MAIYYSAYAIILLLALIFNSENKKKYILFTGIMFFLIAALRSRVIGNDTDIYIRAFETLAKEPLLTASTYVDKDPVFWMMLSLLGKITTNYTILFIIVSGIFTISVWHYIYKYSDAPCLSIIVLLAFNLFQFSLTGMRQTIAISFVLFAYDFLIEKKYIKALLFVVIAALFHKTSLICVVPIIIIWGSDLLHFVWNKKKLMLILFFDFLAFIFRYKVASWISILLSGTHDFEVDMRNQGTTMTAIIFLTIAILIIFVSEETFEDRTISVNYIIASIACFFQLLVPAQSLFFRIAFYFLISYVVVIPNSIDYIPHDNNKKIISIVMYLGLSIQYLIFTSGSSGIVPYQFFWSY